MKDLPYKSTTNNSSLENIRLYFFFFILLLICYFNTFSAEWHFDDIPNILTNKPLHLETLTISSIWDTFFASPQISGKLSRPISNLSFALNWFIGKDSVSGYHIVNFFLHVLNSIILFKTIVLIFKTPKLSLNYSDQASFIAGLATVLWATNPVQTQAVTYIVQRMAVLATLFYISGIFFYLNGRLLNSTDNNKRIIYFLLTFVSFLLALGSKENTIVLPFSLLLIELFFFYHSKQSGNRLLWGLTCCFVVVVGCLLTSLGQQLINDILNTYINRSFTLEERLLTESRILIFYLFLLFFPLPSRLSITHDIELSQSLFSPISTLGSCLFITCIVFGLIYFRNKTPILAFALFFFLLNHLIESTIIPLELIFEHRNYLPSLFLFLPASVFFSKLIHQCTDNSKSYLLSFSLILLILISLALATISRNRIWQSEISLWADSLEKAPNSARSYINMAYQYSLAGNDRKVFELAYLSLDKQSPTPWKDRMRAYNIMGNVMMNIGNYEKAISFYGQALSFSDDNADILDNRSKAQWFAGKSSEALQDLSTILKNDSSNIVGLRLYGEILVALNKFEEGTEVFRQILRKTPINSKDRAVIYLDLALIKSKQGSFDTAAFFINNAQAHGASPLFVSLCRLDNNIRFGEHEKADKNIRQILTHITWPGLRAILLQKPKSRTTLPISYSLLLEYTNNWINKLETAMQ